MHNPTLHDVEALAAPSLTRLLDALALGATLWLAWRACQRRHRHRHQGRCAGAPVHMQTWEGAGGRPLPPEQGVSTATS